MNGIYKNNTSTCFVVTLVENYGDFNEFIGVKFKV